MYVLPIFYCMHNTNFKNLLIYSYVISPYVLEFMAASRYSTITIQATVAMRWKTKINKSILNRFWYWSVYLLQNKFKTNDATVRENER